MGAKMCRVGGGLWEVESGSGSSTCMLMSMSMSASTTFVKLIASVDELAFQQSTLNIFTV